MKTLKLTVAVVALSVLVSGQLLATDGKAEQNIKLMKKLIELEEVSRRATEQLLNIDVSYDPEPTEEPVIDEGSKMAGLCDFAFLKFKAGEISFPCMCYDYCDEHLSSWTCVKMKNYQCSLINSGEADDGWDDFEMDEWSPR